MLYSNEPPSILPLIFLLLIFASTHLSLAHNSEFDVNKGRTLMGFKDTPDGGNVTFACSPSGPCIPCSRSEKSDEKYRCGETGYRIRLKCAPSKNLEAGKTRRSMLEHRDLHVNASKIQRRLLDNSSKAKGGSGAYATYRSCIPAVNEEKLSVLGFESLMLAMVISSGSFIYLRRKRNSARLPTNSTF